MSQEINLSEVDWNKLSINEFHELEKKLQENAKLTRASQPKSERQSGFQTVKIRGELYRIKKVTFQRLKTMKSEKSKEKLIDEIISTHNPIEKL